MALLPLAGSLAGATPRATQNEGPVASRIVPLPSESATGAAGPREILDGLHVRWAGDDPEAGIDSLGAPVPTRTLISVIEQRVDREGGREAGLSVENLGTVLLIRGGAGSSKEALDRAAATAEATVAEFSGLAGSLSYRTRVSLTASGEGVAPLTVLDEERTIAAGSRAGFGERMVRSVVADFDVEVATGQAIADPVVAHVETGETVHLWASTVLDPSGTRQLYVQGLLDVAIEANARSFDPDVYELGVLEQPTVTTYQVMFAGTVPSGAPLVVSLDGMGGKHTGRRLEVTAEPVATTDDTGDAQRIVDLSRGMWRGTLNQSHVLMDSALGLSVPESRMPASAAQLLGLAFGRDRFSRPSLGSSALFLAAKGAAGNQPASSAVQALFESIDPTGSQATVTVRSTADGLTVTLPATHGALVRVARTKETILVLDYNPQVANEATLSDPDSEMLLTGEVMEGVLESAGESLVLRGHVTRRTLTGLSVREANPMDVGRIQQPTLTRASATFGAVSGASTTAAEMAISLGTLPR